jgi:hypothetical protein
MTCTRAKLRADTNRFSDLPGFELIVCLSVDQRVAATGVIDSVQFSPTEHFHIALSAPCQLVPLKC